MSELEIKPENYYLDVLQNPDYYLTGEKPIYKKVIKEAYSREQVLKLLEPQLTIPKSIAEEVEEKKLDDYGVFQTLAQKKHIISDPEPFCDLSDGFISWCENNEKWWAIMNAYLAGKSLGVELVKVVEG